MQPRLLEQIPRFGWTKRTLIDNVALGDGGGLSPVESAVISRPPGMFSVIAFMVGGLATGNGLFGIQLEGSNTGDASNPLEWFPIAFLAPDSQLQSPSPGAQRRMLGGITGFGGFLQYNGTAGNVSVGRFRYLRVRSVIHQGEINVLVAAPGAGATIFFRGGPGGAVLGTLTPAGGPRTPGSNDYDNTLGAANLVAADIAAAINDPLNAFVNSLYATVSPPLSATLLVYPRSDLGLSGFLMSAGSPADVSSSPSFDNLRVRMTGTSGDGEKFARTEHVVKYSGDPTTQYSGVVQRPEGTRYLTATTKLVTATWDPANASGWNVQLQGAIDESSVSAGVWINIEDVGLTDPLNPLGSPPRNGYAQAYSRQGGLVIDMGPFNYFRFEVTPDPSVPPLVNSSFEIDCTCCFDDNDWLDGEQSLARLSTALQSQFFQVRWNPPEPQSGTTIRITGQIVDFNGVPISQRLASDRKMFIILSTSFDDKGNSLHPTATCTSSNLIGTVNNTSRIAVESWLGLFDVIVDDNGVPGDVFLSADPYTEQGPGNSPFPSLLISSGIERLNFV